MGHRNVPGALILLFLLCLGRDSSPPYTFALPISYQEGNQELIYCRRGRGDRNSSLSSSKWPQDSTQQSTTCSACLMLWWTHILLLGLSEHTPHLHFNSLCMWQTRQQPQPAENWSLILQHRAAAQLLEEQPCILEIEFYILQFFVSAAHMDENKTCLFNASAVAATEVVGKWNT